MAIPLQGARESVLLLAALIPAFLVGCGGKPSYNTYEDCILTEVTANQTQAAVVAIRNACRSKFPPTPPSEEELRAAQAAADAAAATGDAAAADAAQAAAEVAAAAADAASAAFDAEAERNSE